jgi:probable rRNA maturation factor
VTTDVFRRARRAPALPSARVRVIADRMLDALGLADAELSVLLTDDATIHALNLEHRGKDGPTDVLAFALDEHAARDALRTGCAGRDLMLGDVVISLDTALRQARSRRRDLLAEVRFLLAHGLLHLCGFDHATARQKRQMDGMTRKLVRAAAGSASGGRLK